MKTITTKEIADAFDLGNRTLNRDIRELLHTGFFTEAKYTSLQNKKLQCYSMGKDGLSLLLARGRFRTPERISIANDLLMDFGVKVSVNLYERANTEDNFYRMLCEFFSEDSLTVERQYSVNGYRIDFHIPEIGLFIEFDEPYHKLPAQAEKDKERWLAIQDYFYYEEDSLVEIIRVNAGEEIKGLGVIAGYITLNTCGAIPICELYENKRHPDEYNINHKLLKDRFAKGENTYPPKEKNND